MNELSPNHLRDVSMITSQIYWYTIVPLRLEFTLSLFILHITHFMGVSTDLALLKTKTTLQMPYGDLSRNKKVT